MSYRLNVLAILLSATIVFGACTSTDVHTFRSTELIGKYYDRILLIVDIPNTTDRRMAEQAFRQAFKDHGLPLFTATELLSKFHDLKEYEILTILEKNNIQSVLLVIPSRAVELAATVEREKSYTSAKLAWANKILYFGIPNPVIPVTELLYSGEEGQFSLRLYDLDSGKIAWLGVSVSEKIVLGSFESLITDNAQETVKTLSAQKLISPAVTVK